MSRLGIKGRTQLAVLPALLPTVAVVFSTHFWPGASPAPLWVDLILIALGAGLLVYLVGRATGNITGRLQALSAQLSVIRTSHNFRLNLGSARADEVGELSETLDLLTSDVAELLDAVGHGADAMGESVASIAPVLSQSPRSVSVAALTGRL